MNAYTCVRRALALTFAGAVIALGLSACTHEAPPDTAVERTAEKDGASMTVRIDRDKVEAGQTLRMTIEVHGEGSGASPLHPPQLAATLGPFDVRPALAKADPNVPPTPQDLRVAHYELSTLETGDLAIPPIELPLGEGTDAPTLATEAIPVVVASLLGGDEDPSHFRDIKGVVDIAMPFDAMRAATIAAIAIAVLLSLAWIWFLLRGTLRGAAPLPPDQQALRDLAALEARKLPQAGRVHEFYVAITDIVRGYVEGRFGIRAPELTTPEFLREARRASAITESHQALLANFLRGADLVKFGGVRPTKDQCDESFAHARTFVRESAPQAEPTADSGGPAASFPTASTGVGVPA